MLLGRQDCKAEQLSAMLTERDLTIADDFEVKQLKASPDTFSMFFRRFWQLSSELSHRQLHIQFPEGAEIQCDMQAAVLDVIANVPGPYGAQLQVCYGAGYFALCCQRSS